MQKAMIQIGDNWITGYCDYAKYNTGEVFTDFAFGETHKIVLSVQKVQMDDGRNWFHILRDATEEEIAESESTEEMAYGGFLDLFTDSK